MSGLISALFSILLATPLVGQDIAVAMSPWTRQATERALSKRTAKTVLLWSVAVENQSSETAMVSESAVLRRVPHLSPYSAKAVELLVIEGERNSGWARAGRLTQDMMFLALYLQVSQVVEIGRNATIGVAAAGSLGPRIVERLKGAEPPVLRNFLELAWREPLQLQPGQAATVYIFTAPGAPRDPVTMRMDAGVTVRVAK